MLATTAAYDKDVQRDALTLTLSLRERGLLFTSTGPYSHSMVPGGLLVMS